MKKLLLQKSMATTRRLDLRTGVNDEDYQVPYKFTGNVNKLTINLGEDKLTDVEHQEMERYFTTVNN